MLRAPAILTFGNSQADENLMSVSDDEKTWPAKKTVIALYAMVVFGLFGLLFRLVAGEPGFAVNIGVGYQFGVFFVVFGAGFLLGFRFPEKMRWVLAFLPLPGGSG